MNEEVISSPQFPPGSLHPARKTNESFEDYKVRRTAENAKVKQHLKGRSTK